MSTRSGRIWQVGVEASPPRTRKGISPTRSPARPKKDSSPPARSPSRKSPARKSPSRKPVKSESNSKYPARKSPSRATKESHDYVPPKSSVKRHKINSNIEIKLHDIYSSVASDRETRLRRTEYSIKDISTQNETSQSSTINGYDEILNSKEIYNVRHRKPMEEVAPRRSSRLYESENDPNIQRSLSKSISKSASKSIGTYSDSENSGEELLKEKSKSVTRKLATPVRDSVTNLAHLSTKWEFGGLLGSAILILVIPSTIFTILLSCSLKSTFNLTIYTSLSVWFSLQTSIIVLVQCIIQAVLLLLPVLGTKIELIEDPGKKVCFNAFFSSIVTVIFIFMMDFYKFFDSSLLLNEYLKLATISYILAVVFAIILYVKSWKISMARVNPYGNMGYVLYDFFIGREIQPYIKKFNVKLWISRLCNINTLILAVLIFKHGIHLDIEATDNLNLINYKEFLRKLQYKPTILVYSMMQLIYVLSFIMWESKIQTTFYWQCEGIGYLQLVTSALYPFYFTSISKFLVDTGYSLSTYALISASILYVLGLSIMLVSNNIKYEFRKNPLHPNLTNVDSMPTFHGKKLIVSHLWGFLRHPNYAGDILIHIALALPGILSGKVMSAAPCFCTVIALMYRAWRDHARCRRRYGAAWQRYCKRVPSVIIPKVI